MLPAVEGEADVRPDHFAVEGGDAQVRFSRRLKVLSDPAGVESLMDAAAYGELVG